MSPGPIQLDQATALTLMLGPNGSVGIQASVESRQRFNERMWKAKIMTVSAKIIALLFVAFALAAPGFSDAQEADRVFVNGNIYTVDEAFSTASAIAIKDGRFIYVGSDAGAQAHISSTTFVSDLEGKTVIPGLHDAHIHIRFGERELYPRIPDIRRAIGEWATVERMQEVIKRSLATGEGMRPGPEPR